MSSPVILLVKIEEALFNKALPTLTEAGYQAVAVSETSQALAQVQKLAPAMLLFDYTLTGSAGLHLCRQLRTLGNRFPILMLVNQETLQERVACLESGADDYLLKPVELQKLQQILRIYLNSTVTEKEQLQYSDLILDLSTRRVSRHQQEADLTMKEFELLKYLMSHPQEVLRREQILENVWGYDFQGESNVIEVYIRYLRLKIEKEGQKRLIHTVRGVGYVLKE